MPRAMPTPMPTPMRAAVLSIIAPIATLKQNQSRMALHAIRETSGWRDEAAVRTPGVVPLQAPSGRRSRRLNWPLYDLPASSGTPAARLRQILPRPHARPQANDGRTRRRGILRPPTSDTPAHESAVRDRAARQPPDRDERDGQ